MWLSNGRPTPNPTGLHPTEKFSNSNSQQLVPDHTSIACEPRPRLCQFSEHSNGSQKQSCQDLNNQLAIYQAFPQRSWSRCGLNRWRMNTARFRRWLFANQHERTAAPPARLLHRLPSLNRVVPEHPALGLGDRRPGGTQLKVRTRPIGRERWRWIEFGDDG